jgi:hypothetical protein
MRIKFLGRSATVGVLGSIKLDAPLDSTPREEPRCAKCGKLHVAAAPRPSATPMRSAAELAGLA